MDDTSLSLDPKNLSSTSRNGSGATSNIDMLMDVILHVTVELGRTKMSMKEVLELQKSSVIELDRLAGDVVDVFVNEHMIARGEVVVVDDKFGVRITELVSINTSGGKS